MTPESLNSCITRCKDLKLHCKYPMMQVGRGTEVGISIKCSRCMDASSSCIMTRRIAMMSVMRTPQQVLEDAEGEQDEGEDEDEDEDNEGEDENDEDEDEDNEDENDKNEIHTCM